MKKLGLMTFLLCLATSVVAGPPTLTPGQDGVFGPGNSGAAHNVGADITGIDSDVNCLGDLRSGAARADDGSPGVGEIVSPRGAENARVSRDLFFVGALPIFLGLTDCSDFF